MLKISVRFLLDNVDRSHNGTGSMLMQVSYKGERRQFSLEIYEVHTSQWEQKKQRFTAKHPYKNELNGILDRAKDRVNQLAFEATMKGEPPLDYIKANYKPKVEKVPTALEALGDFICRREVTRAANTIKTYKGLYNHLSDFTDAKRIKLLLNKLDSAFCEEFIQYLLQDKRVTNTTVEKQISILKAFLQDCHKRGLPVLPDYQAFTFGRSKTTSHVALSVEELRQVVDLDLSGNVRLERVRDIFVFGCLTALRYGDIAQLQPVNLIAVKATKGVVHTALSINTQKTQRRLTIALPPNAVKIIERYGLPLPTLSNQKTNQYLKELAELAGIAQQVERVTYRGAERETQVLPKWQMITTHTARRTFATLAREQGVRLEVVQNLMGHASTRQTDQYVKLTADQLLAETPDLLDNE